MLIFIALTTFYPSADQLNCAYFLESRYTLWLVNKLMNISNWRRVWNQRVLSSIYAASFYAARERENALFSLTKFFLKIVVKNYFSSRHEKVLSVVLYEEGLITVIDKSLLFTELKQKRERRRNLLLMTDQPTLRIIFAIILLLYWCCACIRGKYFQVVSKVWFSCSGSCYN